MVNVDVDRLALHQLKLPMLHVRHTPAGALATVADQPDPRLLLLIYPLSWPPR